MRGSFFTFRVANTGMHTARANLNVTSHNMANMGIHGFSRQVTVQSALPAINLRNGRGMYGTGSAVHNVTQMRDFFIDRRFWSQQAVLGDHSIKVPQLSLIQTMFNELSPSGSGGVLGTFTDFFSRIQELSRNPHDPTFRLNIIKTGEALANNIRGHAVALQQQQRDINGEVRAVVTEINSIGQQITTLNQQIRDFEFDGSHANDLRDQRALLIDRLSHLANIRVTEIDFSGTSGIEHDRRLQISLNGYDFLQHDMMQRLELVARTADQRRNIMDIDGLYDIRFDNGSPFNIYNIHLQGALRGLIDVRDGNGGQITSFQGQSWAPGTPGTPGTFTQDTVGAGQRAVSDFVATINTANTQIATLYAQFNALDANTDVVRFQELGAQLYMALANRNLAYQNMNAVITQMNARDGTSFTVSGLPNSSTLPGARIDAIHEAMRWTELTGPDEIREQIGIAFEAIIPGGVDAPIVIDTLFPGLPAGGEPSSPLVTAPGTPPVPPVWELEARPGNTTLFRGIPFYQNRLNEMVRTFVQAVNIGVDTEGRSIPGSPGHRNGFDLYGEGDRDFFTWVDQWGQPVAGDARNDFATLTTLNFGINAELLNNPRLLGASTNPMQGESDNDVVLGFLEVGTFQSLFREGRLEDFIIATSGFLAIDIRQSIRFRNNYNEVIAATTNQRAAVSDVDMNEELMNMTRFRNLFSVNARMIAAMNEVYDTLINRLGV